MEEIEFYSGAYPPHIYKNCKAGKHEWTGNKEDACLYCVLDVRTPKEIEDDNNKVDMVEGEEW